MDGATPSQMMAAQGAMTPGMQALAQAIRGRGRELGRHASAFGMPGTTPFPTGAMAPGLAQGATAALTPADQGGLAANPMAPSLPPAPMPTPQGALAASGLGTPPGSMAMGAPAPGSLSMMGGGLPMRAPGPPMGATFGLGGR